MTKVEIREKLSKIIKEEYQNHIIMEGITGWLIDKVANGLKWYTNKKADYQYDALLNSKDFKSMASKFGYKDEEAFVKKSKELIKKDPKKFADILAYDVRKSDLRKFGVW